MPDFTIREIIETPDEELSSDDESLITPEQHELNQALCQAAYSGSLDEVNELLAQGAAPNAKIHAKVSIYHHNENLTGSSTEVGSSDCSEMPTAFPGEKNPAALGKAEVVIPVLMLAAKRGDISIVQALIARGANPNVMVSLTTNPNVDPALSQISLLTSALEHRALFQWLLTVVSPVVKTDMLHFLVRHVEEIDIIKLIGHFEDLKSANADFNVRDSEGRTALMIAVYRGYLMTVSALLQQGADPNIVYSETGQTALHIATAFGDAKIMRVLIQGGANVCVYSQFGSTPLHILAAMPMDTVTIENRTLHMMGMDAQCEMVELLLQSGADINAQTTDKLSTALMAAVAGQKYEFVQLLLANGARIDIQDKGGYNAIDHALMQPNTDFRILDLLCERAKIDKKLFIEVIILAAQLPDERCIDRLLTHRVDDGIQPTLKYLAKTEQFDLLAGLCNGQSKIAENVLIQAMMQSVSLDRREGLDFSLFSAVHAAAVLLVAADTCRPLSDAKKWMNFHNMASFFDKSSPEAQLATKAAHAVVMRLLDAGCRDHRLLAPLLYRGKKGFEETLAVAIADFYTNKPGSDEGLAIVKAALVVGERMLAINAPVADNLLKELFSRTPDTTGPSSSSSLPTTPLNTSFRK